MSADIGANIEGDHAWLDMFVDESSRSGFVATLKVDIAVDIMCQIKIVRNAIDFRHD